MRAQSSYKFLYLSDEGGDMHYHLTTRGMFSEEEVRFYAAEIALGLGHMHSQKVVYRDLKVGILRFCDDCRTGSLERRLLLENQPY